MQQRAVRRLRVTATQQPRGAPARHHAGGRAALRLAARRRRPRGAGAPSRARACRARRQRAAPGPADRAAGSRRVHRLADVDAPRYRLPTPPASASPARSTRGCSWRCGSRATRNARPGTEAGGGARSGQRLGPPGLASHRPRRRHVARGERRAARLGRRRGAGRRRGRARAGPERRRAGAAAARGDIDLDGRRGVDIDRASHAPAGPPRCVRGPTRRPRPLQSDPRGCSRCAGARGHADSCAAIAAAAKARGASRRRGGSDRGRRAHRRRRLAADPGTSRRAPWRIGERRDGHRRHAARRPRARRGAAVARRPACAGHATFTRAAVARAHRLRRPVVPAPALARIRLFPPGRRTA